jgi:hypothetical protein
MPYRELTMIDVKEMLRRWNAVGVEGGVGVQKRS